MTVNLFAAVNEAQVKAAKVRVSAGAALFDEFRPGWRERIALTSLDISSVVECALGQEYGDYSTGLDELRQAVRDAGRHPGYSFAEDNGFMNGYDSVTGEDVTYEALASAWREEIFGRPMTTEEKFAATLNDQVRNVVNARVQEEKNLAKYRKSVEQTLALIAQSETRIASLKTDEDNGRDLVRRVMSA